MLMCLTDEPTVELVSEKKVIETAEIIQLKAVNRMLVGACYEALRLRGLWTAINDPLGLEMERHERRAQFKKIELSIRAAIEKADAVMNEK